MSLRRRMEDTIERDIQEHIEIETRENIDRGIRDLSRVAELPDFAVFARGVDPSAIANVTLVGVNVPIRIGGATVLLHEQALHRATDRPIGVEQQRLVAAVGILGGSGSPHVRDADKALEIGDR